MQSLIGQVVGNYKIEELIGRGGMGSVYLARHSTLDSFVAIKVMQATLSDDETSRIRFLREAKKGAQLDHPNIVKVYDYHEIDDTLFIVMEYVAGDNVRQQLKSMHQQQQWVQLAESAYLVQQLALALDYAHENGVIHRDIKPDNVLLKPVTSGKYPYRPVLVDLGLVRSEDDGGTITIGGPIGTPGYMSPEHALGQPVTTQSDIYSLGVMLYELAVGHIPLKPKNLQEAYRLHIQRQLPPSARTVRPDLPVALERLISTAIAYQPQARFPTAGAMAEAIEEVLQVPLPTTPPPGNFTAVVHFSTTRKGREIIDLGPKVEHSPAEPNQPGLFTYEESRLPILPINKPVSPEKPGAASANFLVVEHRDGGKYWMPLTTGTMTIGRGEGNTLHIPDDHVSRSHLRIEFDGQRLRLTDLDSRNGVYLDGQKLLPGVPQVWDLQKSLNLGRDYSVSLRNEMPETNPPFEEESEDATGVREKAEDAPEPITPVTSQPPPSASNTEPRTTKGWRNGCLAIILLLAMFVVILLVTNLRNSMDRSSQNSGNVPTITPTVYMATPTQNRTLKIASMESPTATNAMSFPTETDIPTSTFMETPFATSILTPPTNTQTSTSTPTITPSDTPTVTPLPVALTDSFTDDHAGWGEGSLDGMYVSGERKILNGKYRWTLTGKNVGGVTRSTPWMDDARHFHVSVRVDQSGEINPGLIFRDDTNSFYFAKLYYPDSVCLSHYDGTDWNNLIACTYIDSVNPDSNNLSVVAYGEDVMIFVNNRFAGSTNKLEQSAGKVGLAAELDANANGEVKFDDFSLWSTVVTDRFNRSTQDFWWKGSTSNEWGDETRSVSKRSYEWFFKASKGVHLRATNYYNINVGDFFMALDAKLETDCSCRYGVDFRQQNNDYYSFEIDNSQRYRFSLYKNEGWTTLIDSTSSNAIKPNQFNRLYVRAIGPYFSFFVNGIHLQDYYDAQLSFGDISPSISLDGGESSTFNFDNFVLMANESNWNEIRSQ